MMKTLAPVALILMLTMLPFSVEADLISMTFGGTGDVDLNSSNLGTLEFELTFLGDTDDVFIHPSFEDVYIIGGLIPTIFIEGTGTFAGLEAFDVYSNVGVPGVGICCLASDDLLRFSSGTQWFMDTSFGVPAGSPAFSNLAMDTELGMLVVSPVSTASFVATVVPEPTSLLLLGSGLIGLIGLRKRSTLL